MRHPDWPARLAGYLESRRATPFAWGSHDCCRFAAGAAEAMTGRDAMAAFTYRNELGAQRLIRRAGSLDELVRRTLGEPLPTVLRAGRGDVVLADLERGPTVGLCLGQSCAFAGDVGVVYRPLAFARLAWRIE